MASLKAVLGMISVWGLLLAPEAFQMGHPLFKSFHGNPGVQLKDLDMVGFNELSERLEVNHAGAWGAMIPAWELDVVDVEAGQGRGH